MSNPTVSIVVPTYNREALLPRAIDSIIAQTFEDWEIILVDDGSTDATAELAERYRNRIGRRLVHLRQANTGCCAARNRGIEAARGRFVAFLDSDDEYLPHKLERQLRLFELRPDLGLVYSDYAYVDTAGVRHDSVFDTVCLLAREVPCDTVAPGLCVCTGSLFDVLIRGYFIATIVGMVRREVFDEGIRFSQDPSYSEEWLFYLQVARVCRAGFVDEPLCLHHHVLGSISRTDSHRNTVRLRTLLLTMSRTFADAPRRHRRIIRHKLADTCLQLGYNHFHRQNHWAAFCLFAESYFRRPGLRGIRHVVQAGTHALWAASRARVAIALPHEAKRALSGDLVAGGQRSRVAPVPQGQPGTGPTGPTGLCGRTQL